MNGIQNNFLSNAQIMDQYLNTTKASGDAKTNSTSLKTENGLSFQDVLFGKLDEVQKSSELKFSKHASNRLMDRGIELTTDQMNRLSEGANRAGEKGIKDSLVMVDNLAFIVNVPNQTVITAMDQTRADENIFTNIDGAVIV